LQTKLIQRPWDGRSLQAEFFHDGEPQTEKQVKRATRYGTANQDFIFETVEVSAPYHTMFQIACTAVEDMDDSIRRDDFIFSDGGMKHADVDKTGDVLTTKNG